MKLALKDTVALRRGDLEARHQAARCNVPCNGYVSIPFRPCMCVPIRIRTRVVVFPLLSAPSSSVRRTFRTRRLPLTIHAGMQCAGCYGRNRRLSKVVEVGDLTFENIHSHIEVEVEFVTANMQFGEA